MTIPEIKLTPCAIVKEKVPAFYCKDCFFFSKEFCKQYQIEVAENDGCSNYELKGGITYGS